MRNKTWRALFSVLLAVALLLPMAPAARAVEGGVPAETVSSVKLSASAGTVYFRKGYAGEVTVTAAVDTGTGAKYNGDIRWSLDDGDAPLAFVSPATGSVADGVATVTLQAKQPSVNGDNVVLTAWVGGKYGTIAIKVEPDAVRTDAIRFTNTNITLNVGGTAQLSLDPKPAYPSGNGTPTVEYRISSRGSTAVASVDKDSGLVTAKAEGLTYISAYVDGTPLEKSEVTVSVLPRAATPLTGNATLGVNYSMRDIYSSLLTQFSGAYSGKTPVRIYFPGLGTVNGILCTSDGDNVASSVLVSGYYNNPYDFTTLRDMYLKPNKEGTFQCKVLVMDADGNTLEGNITITIAVPNHTIRIPVDGSSNYNFLRPSADPAGRTGVQLIREAIGTFGSIEFGAVSSASSNVGTLYTGNPPSSDNRVSTTGGTVVAASEIDELYFTPSRAGTYSIPFTAYSGANRVGRLCTGTLMIPVDGSSLDINFTLSSLSPYTFSDSPRSGANSLYSEFLTAINGSFSSSAWDGIKFDASSASSTGTLHQSNAYSRAISSSDYISKAYISRLYFEPERSGTYEVTYGIYESQTSTSPLATGKLTIKTSTIPLGASNITYTTSVKESVSLKEGDFIDFFREQNGSNSYLSYVVFSEYDGGGTFYHDSTSFLPYNSSDFYTSTYTGKVPTNARYLDRVTFTAPATAGYTAVLFTCYGGTTSDSSVKTLGGKLCIYYSADTVPVVTFNVLNLATVDLSEDSFVPAYNAAMKTSLSKPTFNIQLLSAPTKGTLYQYYGGGTNRRALTSNNISNYIFTVNDRNGSSIGELSYMPGRNATGTDEITYLATASNGTSLYVGTIQFKLTADVMLNVTNDGSNFQLADFYNASESDPVLYITFPQPSAGKVYVYNGNRYIAASSTTKFYTASASNGEFPLTNAFYAPRANETGTVSLKCDLHRKSGATSSSTVTMNVLSKSSSGSFGDVTGVTGWAANSIDFASKMGLVNGTQLNPPRFSPSDSMRRSDFVLMLYRLAGSPSVSGTVPYTDVTPDKYYYSSAVWAYQNSIMRNVTTGTLYNPEGALTRQDFAQILFNYTAAVGESTANNGSIASYVDASSVSPNTREGVTWAVAKGYITSAVVGQLYIEPTRSATRAEISTLLHRYLTY